MLFTGFPANTNIANITFTVVCEFIPASGYAAICPIDYASIGPSTDEICNDCVA